MRTRRVQVRFALCLVAVWMAASAWQSQVTHDAEAAPGASAQAIDRFLDGRLPSVTPTLPDENADWELVDAFPNLPSFTDPVHMLQRPGTNTLWLLELNGRIYSFDHRPDVSSRELVLDIRSDVLDGHDSGALSFAFHPNFGIAGQQGERDVYLAYRYSPDHRNNHQGFVRLSRFTMSGNGRTLNRNSEFILIQQYDDHNWHNGCAILFGPDGFLYMTVGDEGGANDAFNAAQEIDTGLFSGVLRIDVDQDPTKSHPIRRQPRPNTAPPSGYPSTFSQGYFIPNDNPFLDPDGGVLEEFYCIGLRSPHRMFMDPVTHEMWIGDIGQGTIEEVSIVRRAANFEWPWREGTRVNGTKPSLTFGDDTGPEYDYTTEIGRCVIGGHVYRGSLHPDLYGKYIFGDNVSNYVYALPRGATVPETLVRSPLPSRQTNGITSINVDAAGELYIMALHGRGTSGARIRTLRREGGGGTAQPPARLSEVGAFSNLATLTPVSGLRPYEINTPLWSDGADKQRFIAIPNDGTHNSADERIGFSATGNWTFPIGTVLVKHFELEGVRLETRFLVHGADGVWYGLTYRWRADNSDADLLPGAFEETVQADGETFTWHYPSRQECATCHTAAAGHVLGVRTQQLNRDCTDPVTGATENQLRAWNNFGVFDSAFEESDLALYLRARSLDDTTATLERRARSYLDSNCSQCHQPGGVRTDWDARLPSPPLAQRTLDEDPGDPLGIGNARVIAPGSTFRSVLFERVQSLDGCCAMPTLAKARVDQEALDVLRPWILSLDPSNASSRGLSDGQVDALRANPDLVAPLVTLTAPATATTSPIAVRVQSTEALVGLTAGDFVVTNGVASDLTPNGDEWVLDVVPQAAGLVRVSLPSDVAWDAVVNANVASNTTTTDYTPDTPPPPPPPPGTEPDGPPNPAFWMRFNEGTGTTAAGGGANARAGTLQGGATWTGGQYGGGVALDGSGWVEVPYTDALRISDHLTLATWVHASRFRDWDGVITSGGAQSPWALQLWSDGAIRFTANWAGPSGAQGSGSWNSNGQLTLNTWHHVAVTYDGSTLRFYLDGVRDPREVNVALRFGQGQDRFVLGAGLPGVDEFLRGSLDDTRVYDRALSDTEVESLMGSGTPPPPPPPPPVDTDPPTVALSTASNAVTGAFVVDVVFNEPVTGLDASDAQVVNGTVDAMTGSGTTYALNVVPTSEGVVQVALPAGAAADAAGNGSLASSPISVTYTAPPAPPPATEPAYPFDAALWLKFNEGTGAFAAPFGANAHSGRLTGATWTDGRFGNAVFLDGNDQVDVSGTQALDITGALTLSAWVRPDRLRDWDAIITRGGFSSPWGLTQGPGGRLRFTANWGAPQGASGAGTRVSEGTLDVGTWHHVAVTYDGARVRFYIDGVEDPISHAADLTFGVGEERFVIGAGLPASDEYFLGAVDDARVFARALDGADLRVLASIDAPPAPPPAPQPLVALVNFQPAAVAAPAGYLADAGEIYGEHPTRWYGWTQNLMHAVTRRNVAADVRLDTVMLAQNATWEIELPNGTYDVTVVAGDPSVSSVADADLEGTTLWSGAAINAGSTRTRTVTVTLTDGRLTLSTGATMTHLAYLEIRGQ